MPSLDPIFSASNMSNFGVSNREFPEFFKTLPTFISSPFQSGVIAKKTQKSIFWEDTLYVLKTLLILSHLIESPDIAELVLLVLALDNLHLALNSLLVEHGADQVRHEPVQGVQEMFLGDVKVEVRAGGGSEGVIAPPLQT